MSPTRQTKLTYHKDFHLYSILNPYTPSTSESYVWPSDTYAVIYTYADIYIYIYIYIYI